MEENKLLTLDTPVEELEERLLKEHDADEVKNIIELFNLNIKKKNVIRTEKLSQLQDLISNQMRETVEQNADAFSNKDLLEYFKTIQETVSKADMSPDVKIPIQINQQITIESDSDKLDRASKERVVAAIQAILNRQESPIPADFEVVEDNKEEDLHIVTEDGNSN